MLLCFVNFVPYNIDGLRVGVQYRSRLLVKAFYSLVDCLPVVFVSDNIEI